MRRWHEERSIMVARWRAHRRRHRGLAFDSLEDARPRRDHPGYFRKRRPFDCGRPRCHLCHGGKLIGYRPQAEATLRGRQNARLEALRHEAAAWGDGW